MSITVSISTENLKSSVLRQKSLRQKNEDVYFLVETYPAIDLVTKFVYQCWKTNGQHTASFRLTCAKVCDAVLKCLSHIEYEIFGIEHENVLYDGRTRSIPEQVYFYQIKESVQNLGWHMKLSFTLSSVLKESDANAASISFDPTGFDCLETLAAWDYLYDKNGPSFGVYNCLLALMSGIIVSKAK